MEQHLDLRDNQRPPFDQVIKTIADYVCNTPITSALAFQTAQWCLADAMGCAILGLRSPACRALLGPWVPGITVEKGVKVLGTGEILDPIKAAFDMGTLIRWHDYNDTWLAKEWGHPSDNLGALLSVMDYVNQHPERFAQRQYTVKDLCEAMIKAYEIQGVLALSNSFNQVGLDHVVLVKLASCAVVTHLLGGDPSQVEAAISQVWVDGQSLRTYRHAPNTGSRKSWAAGDATSRGVRLAMLTLQGEKGTPSALTATRWGFQDVSFGGNAITITQPLGSYVMENILFKIAYPAEFHAQTAIECAVRCYDWIKNRWDEIQSIEIQTHLSALRIIDKTGPLHSPADRDHCMQYMVAIALLKGTLVVEDYLPPQCDDPRIEALRNRMVLTEDPQFSLDYLDPAKRAIPNRILITLKNGEKRVEACEYPLGHVRRREEGVPLLWQKCRENLKGAFSEGEEAQWIQNLQSTDLLKWSVSDLLARFQVK